jgi:hypothetical protein
VTYWLDELQKNQTTAYEVIKKNTQTREDMKVAVVYFTNWER